MVEQASILQPEDIEEIIKAAKETTTTHNKDWLLAQLRGAQGRQRTLKIPSNSGESMELSGGKAEGSKELEGPKKHCCIASRDSKKTVRRKADGIAQRHRRSQCPAPARSR
ncbi:hypothetical protein NDU88_003851 [Pleurodeles waltl]|uniref:Uncharacterized protein n=1 Tax=Pleurodeles waltl TaxID=8319 RepID=A0AAV7WQ77_PLEWA|nr:hypothetical protein NDU88_003851 [Pleurodeles waltl]